MCSFPNRQLRENGSKYFEFAIETHMSLENLKKSNLSNFLVVGIYDALIFRNDIMKMKF